MIGSVMIGVVRQQRRLLLPSRRLERCRTDPPNPPNECALRLLRRRKNWGELILHRSSLFPVWPSRLLSQCLVPRTRPPRISTVPTIHVSPDGMSAQIKTPSTGESVGAVVLHL